MLKRLPFKTILWTICLAVFLSATPVTSLAFDVTLIWDANSEPDLVGYRVFARQEGQSYNYSSPAWEGTATTCTLQGLVDNVVYYFVVRAFDTQDFESADSVEVSTLGDGGTPAQYSLAINVNGSGTVVANPAGGTYDAGTTVALTAMPSAGWTFDRWSGAVTGTSPSASVVMDAHKIVTANFVQVVPNRFNLNVSIDGAGSVALSPSGGIYDEGTTVTLTATPNTDWGFSGWSGDAGGTANPISVVMNADKTVTASFAFQPPPNTDPEPPAPNFPTGGTGNVPLAPTLSTGAFSDLNPGDTHDQTHWQIFRTSDNRQVLDVVSTGYLTQLPVPRLILDPDTAYYWRARFYDSQGAVSAWSPNAAFTTLTAAGDNDANGILDSQEVDDTVDLDGDGVPDNFQPDSIKTVLAEVGNGQLAVNIRNAVGVTSIDALQAIDPAEITDTANKPLDMTMGVLAYKITMATPGDSTQIALHLSEPVPVDAGWYKYDAVTGWSDYSAYTTLSADRKTVTIELIDGDFGDADGLANGIIVDPAGFGLPPGVSFPSGGSGTTSGSNGSCFIATATQGSNMALHLQWLRSLRDRILGSVMTEATYVEVYDRYSSPSKSALATTPPAKISVHQGYRPLGLGAWLVMNPAAAAALCGTMLLAMGVFFAGWRYCRRHSRLCVG